MLSGASLGLVGEKVDLTYPVTHLGEGADALDAMLKGAKG